MEVMKDEVTMANDFGGSDDYGGAYRRNTNGRGII